MPAKFELIAPCFFGCESTAKFELNRIGAENIRVDDGRLTFSGGAEMIAAANLHLRTVERVMLLLARYKASTFDELFDGCYNIAWEELLPANAAFPVKGSSLSSQLSSVPACQSIVKKAIVKRLQYGHKTTTLPETGALYKIRFALRKNVVEVMLDTSGDGLHKRGYRKNATLAPIKETLAATIAKLEGNTHYVDKYWDLLKTWTDYLVDNGQDPANQLCTDDFAGHWAHNANLSIKAIMGVAGFAEMARIKGDAATADKYMAKARAMATQWEQTAREGNHYRLAFDRPNTWSQKYNMVWDKLWNINIFPNNAMQKEVKFYLTKQNKYGLPLDVRKDYTKNDWIMWTAAMASDNKTFLKFVDPIYDYINETQSRVPISDWYDTKTGLMVGFKARSVIGGFWMKVLADKMATAR